MSLQDTLVNTLIAQPGMTVAELFAECIRTGIPGLPFMDGSGQLVGKASIRHVLKMNCMPDYLVQHSHLLGDAMEHLRFPEIQCHEVMARSIDEMVVAQLPTVGVNAPVSKALARMEQFDTTYLFVLDSASQYLGAVTIIGLAAYLYTRADGH
jgi:CBS domain-containing protein